MNNNLYIKTFNSLLSKLPKDLPEDTILIGGQALALWAAHYNDKRVFEKNSLILSSDIDFLGGYSALDKLATAWEAEKLDKSEPFDPTPNTGIFTIIDPEGDERIVDVLKMAHGIEQKDLDKFTDQLAVNNVSIKVISPPLCLLSRVKNLELYEKQGHQYKLDRENQVRIPLAKELTKNYINDLLDKNEVRTALNIVKFLDDNLLVDAVPIEHKSWPDKFKNIHYPALLGKQQEKLARKGEGNYQKNSARKAENGVSYKGEIISVNYNDKTAVQQYGKSTIIHDVSRVAQNIKPGKIYLIYHGDNKSIAKEQKPKRLTLKR